MRAYFFTQVLDKPDKSIKFAVKIRKKTWYIDLNL